MSETRNFRSCYLEKFAVKGNEEKKPIDSLFEEQTLDIRKLKSYCLKFPIPAVYRTLVWKSLLGVLPARHEDFEFVSSQQKQQYEDMEVSLHVMGRVDKHTPSHELHLKMLHVEQGLLPFNEQEMFQEEGSQAFTAIDQSMAEIADDHIDVYWMTKKFYNQQCSNHRQYSMMGANVEVYLKREDTDGRLYAHLSKLETLKKLPLKQWFLCGFAGVLSETALERLWDKVMGGSVEILVYVAVAILLTLQRPLLTISTNDNLLGYLCKVPPDSGEAIIGKAIELWQKHGSL